MTSLSFAESDSKKWIWALFFICIFLLEFFWFRSYVLREIAPYFPFAMDQAGYLRDSYIAYDAILHTGLIAGLSGTSKASSFIFIPQAALFFLLTGASRLSALSINFIYFIVLQAMVVYTVLFFTKKHYLAVLLLGLLLSVGTPYITTGGLPDFRIDFSTFCLYGILTCLVLRSEIFLHTRWTFLSAVIAVLLVLMRPVTSSYLFLTFVTLFFIVLCFKHDERLRRLKNIIFFSVILVIVSFPFLWANLQAIQNYYVVNHITGPEKYIRMKETGTTTFLKMLSFYPRSIFNHHVGHLAEILLAILLVLVGFKRSSLHTVDGEKNHLASFCPYFFKLGISFLGLMILSPLILLTLDPSKSPVVGSIAVTPIIWIVFWLFIFKAEPRLKTVAAKSMLAFAFLLLGVGKMLFTFYHPVDAQERENKIAISRMYSDLGNYAAKAGWSDVQYSTNVINDAFVVEDLTDLYYEQNHVLLRGDMALGSSLYAVNTSDALKALANTDVLILVPHEGASSPYPFDASTVPLYNLLKGYAAAHFILLGEYPYNDKTVLVYVRKLNHGGPLLRAHIG